MEEEEEGGVGPVWPLNDVVKAKNASAEYVPSLRRSARSSPRRNRRLNYRARLFSVHIFILTPLSHTLSLLPPRPRSLSQMSSRPSTSSRCPHSSNRIRRGEGRIYLDLEPKDANTRLQKSFTSKSFSHWFAIRPQFKFSQYVSTFVPYRILTRKCLLSI